MTVHRIVTEFVLPNVTGLCELDHQDQAAWAYTAQTPTDRSVTEGGVFEDRHHTYKVEVCRTCADLIEGGKWLKLQMRARRPAVPIRTLRDCRQAGRDLVGVPRMNAAV